MAAVPGPKFKKTKTNSSVASRGGWRGNSLTEEKT
jgi:hypothetical protein